MLKVGLTGGIGSGKTTVAQLFNDLKIPIYNADKRAKALMRSDKPLKNQIKKLLGASSYHNNGYPNRSFIAENVFKNKTLLNQLNSLIHPAVKKDLSHWFMQQTNAPYAIYESAIIFKSKTYQSLDKIIGIRASREIRIKRVLRRNKTTRENIIKRMDHQMSDTDRLKKCDYIIDNENTSIDQLNQQIIQIDSLLRSSKNKKTITKIN